jgi:hypothetical protein
MAAAAMGLRPFIGQEADIFLVPTLACRALAPSGPLCLLEFLDTLRLANTSNVNLTVVFPRFCSPCFIKVVQLLRHINVSVPFLPALELLCQRDPLGHPCFPAVVHALSQSHIMALCAPGPSDECTAALGNYTGGARCCSRTLLPLIPDRTQAASLAQYLPPVCPFLGRQHALIRFFLRNANLTAIAARWAAIRERIRQEIAAILGIPVDDVTSVTADAPTTTTAKRAGTADAVITATVQPSGSSYALTDLSNTAADSMAYGEVQLSAFGDPAVVVSADQPVVVSDVTVQVVQDTVSSSSSHSASYQPINPSALAASLQVSFLAVLMALAAALLL